MGERSEKGIRVEEVQQRHLPDEVIIEHILPCLPIKPLTQFKLASKLWYSSISSPNFILKHTKQPLISHSSSPLETLLVNYGESYYLYSLANDDNVVNRNEPNNLVKLNPKFDIDVGDHISLIGSSNGLICLGDMKGKYFILWNPTTNESHKYYCHDIEVTTDCRNNLILGYASWGMGYVSSVNDYKVVRIIHYNTSVGNKNSVHVFSLRSNTWRKIECDSFNMSDWLFIRPAKLANATLYWLARSVPGSMMYAGFDLVHETFDVVVPEMGLRGEMIYIVGGCLSKCSPNSEGVLILDVDKHSERVDSIRLPNSLKQGGVSELIGFTKLGNIVVAYNSRKPITLGLIDLHLNSIKSLVTNEDQGITSENSNGLYFGTHIQSYSPTQVSPLPFK